LSTPCAPYNSIIYLSKKITEYESTSY
jgi:hypothetical protein